MRSVTREDIVIFMNCYVRACVGGYKYHVLIIVWVKLLELCVLLCNSCKTCFIIAIELSNLYLTDTLLAPPAADSDGESDGSDRVPVPSFQNSFSQAFEKALLQLDNGPASSPQPVVVPGLASVNEAPAFSRFKFDIFS